jgi:hypothetical protein
LTAETDSFAAASATRTPAVVITAAVIDTSIVAAAAAVGAPTSARCADSAAEHKFEEADATTGAALP